jgi:hypothetical protein
MCNIIVFIAIGIVIFFITTFIIAIYMIVKIFKMMMALIDGEENKIK